MYASFSQLDISYCSWSTGDQSSKEQVDREFLEEEAAVGLGFCVLFFFFFFHAKDCGSVVVGSLLWWAHFSTWRQNQALAAAACALGKPRLRLKILP